MVILNLPQVVFGIFILGIVFIAARKLMLWYFKIDERLLAMKETNRLLRKLAGESDTPGTTPRQQTYTEAKIIKHNHDHDTGVTPLDPDFKL